MISAIELEGSRRDRGLLFAFAVTIVGCLYVLLLPLAAYFTSTMMTAFDAETPKLIAALIRLSPWLPLGIGVACVGFLFWSRGAQGATRWVMYWSTTSAVVIGLFWLTLTLLPAFQLMVALQK